MRMGQDGPTAADVIARASEADLANIIYIFGEERHSRAVARAIVAARKEAPITTTRALADLVAQGRAREARRDSPGDADVPGVADLRQRRNSTSCIWRCPPPSACSSPAAGWPWCRSIRSKTASSRISSTSAPRPAAVRGICRRSRRLRRALRVLTKRPVSPGDDEVAANPRARSAKLRAAERTDAPAHAAAELPAWPHARRRDEGRLTHAASSISS